MRFDRSDLQQLTPEYIEKLSHERIVVLCEQLRQDLIQAKDCLNQNPSNSSRPPSTRAPWERKPENESIDDAGDTSKSEQLGYQAKDAATGVADSPNAEDAENREMSKTGQGQKRNPGRQPGSKGFGRTQKLLVTHEITHKPVCCKGCAKIFEPNAEFQATYGYCSIDISPLESGKIGISGTYTKHIFGTTQCDCGYETTTTAYRAEKDAFWSVEMGEWRLIGPMLLAFIVFAKLRLHLTISKTQDLLAYWFGISLSKGAISTALLEAGRAVSYLQPELMAALRASGLLYVDETSWKEHKINRWLWVAVGDQVVYFSIGPRSLEMAQRIIGEFSGNLMTDGYTVYRSLKNRLRCWAHLQRKAKALAESCDKGASVFGSHMMAAMKLMQKSVYKMREMQANDRKVEAALCDEVRLKVLIECLKHQDANNEKVQAFSGEILNDNQAIFRVLQEPDLPLTNNAAEQALRPLVILRKISYGSKTDEASRALSLLASVTGTIFLRGHHAWNFLAHLFKDRKIGHAPLPLPAPITLSS